MKTIIIMAAAGFVLVALFLFENIAGCGLVEAVNDKDIFERIVVIKGKVIELNNLDLGQVAAHGSTPIVFRRLDCKSCIVSTRPDLDGNYEIQLGRGKYKLIVMAPSPPQHDLLAPDQQRILDAGNGNSVIQFDIKLKLPQ